MSTKAYNINIKSNNMTTRATAFNTKSNIIDFMSIGMRAMLTDFTLKVYDIMLIPISVGLKLTVFIIKPTDLVVHLYDFDTDANDFAANLYSLTIKSNSFTFIPIKAYGFIIKSIDNRVKL